MITSARHISPIVHSCGEMSEQEACAMCRITPRQDNCLWGLVLASVFAALALHAAEKRPSQAFTVPEPVPRPCKLVAPRSLNLDTRAHLADLGQSGCAQPGPQVKQDKGWSWRDARRDCSSGLSETQQQKTTLSKDAGIHQWFLRCPGRGTC